MSEKYPIHIMIKPEGLEYFPDFIRSRIELFQDITGATTTTHMLTRLAPEHVELIYPKDTFTPEVREAIVYGKTEHYIFHSTAPDIYEQARLAKGKANIDSGIRGALVREINRVGLKFEKWQNFVHSSDTLEETHAICFHFNKDLPVCTGCAAKSLCYGNLEGSAMPNTSLVP